MSFFRFLAAAGLAVAVGGIVVAADAIKPDLKNFKWKCKFDNGESLGGYDENENRFFLYTFGTATGDVNIPEDGEYKITVEASCTKVEKEYGKFKLSVGDVVVAKEFECTTEDPKKYTFSAKLKKGKQPIVIEFLNDKFKEGEYDLNLFVHEVALEQKPAPKPTPTPTPTPTPGTVAPPVGQAPPGPATAAPCDCGAMMQGTMTHSRRGGRLGGLFHRRGCRGCY